MWPNLQFLAYMTTFTEEIISGNLIFVQCFISKERETLNTIYQNNPALWNHDTENTENTDIKILKVHWFKNGTSSLTENLQKMTLKKGGIVF